MTKALLGFCKACKCGIYYSLLTYGPDYISTWTLGNGGLPLHAIQPLWVLSPDQMDFLETYCHIKNKGKFFTPELNKMFRNGRLDLAQALRKRPEQIAKILNEATE